MRNKHLLLTIIFVICSLKGIQAQSYFQDEYIEVWKRTIAYSLEVATKMPDSLYHYRPTKESMNFKEQQLHMVNNISFLTKYITGKNIYFYEKAAVDNIDKKELLQILSSAFTYVNRLILQSDSASIAEKIHFQEIDMSKENIFYLLRNHLSHHRAQSIVYLRLNNLEPPKYIGW